MKTAIYSKPLTIALEQGVYDQIKTITDDLRISMAEWVRTAVQKSLSDHQEKASK